MILNVENYKSKKLSTVQSTANIERLNRNSIKIKLKRKKVVVNFSNHKEETFFSTGEEETFFSARQEMETLQAYPTNPVSLSVGEASNITFFPKDKGNNIINKALDIQKKARLMLNSDLWESLENESDKIYKEHQNNNWDNHNALKVTFENINLSKKFIKKLIEIGLEKDYFDGLEMSPLNDGSIGFDWLLGQNQQISIELQDEKVFYGFHNKDEEGSMVISIKNDESIKNLINLIKKIHD